MTSLFEIARQGQNVLIRCSCGHREIAQGSALDRLFFLRRWDTELASLPRHLRCGRCRGKDLQVAASSQPHTKVIGPADEAEWKALQRRLRD